METMTQETTRLVWEGMLEADRLSRYYGYLAEKLETREQHLAIVATVLSSTAFVSLWTDLGAWNALSSLPPWVVAVVVSLPKLLTLAASIVTALLISGRNSRRALKSSTIRRRFSDLLMEWEIVWAHVQNNSKTEQYSRKRWEELTAKANDITDGADVELPLDVKLRELSQKETYDYWQKSCLSRNKAEQA